MIQGQIQMWAESADMELETNSLRDLFFSVAKYEQDSGAGMDRILAGLINQARSTYLDAERLNCPSQTWGFPFSILAHRPPRGTTSS